MKKVTKMTTSIVLSLLMIFSCFAAPFASAAEYEEKTVYVKNNMGWHDLYCYMWENDGMEKNAPWPGQKMQYEGNDIWSYSVKNNYHNIIFDNGNSGVPYNQTENLILPGDNFIYKLGERRWSEYIEETSPKITSDKISGYLFTDTLNVTLTVKNGLNSYYTVNDSEQIYFYEQTTFTLGSDDKDTTMYKVRVCSSNQFGDSEEIFYYERFENNNDENTRTVYVRNSYRWSTVYCYMWGGEQYMPWPGKEMQYEGNDVWSYTFTDVTDNIIFNCGFNNSSYPPQTRDLRIPDNGYIYDVMNDSWSKYINTLSPPQISSDKANNLKFTDTLEVNLYVAQGDESYYIINDGEKIFFKDQTSFVIGNDVDEQTQYTVNVYSSNNFGAVKKTFIYTKILETPITDSNEKPKFASKNNLYAHSTILEESSQTWQKWETESSSAGKTVHYFLLPKNTNDCQVEIYNTYDENIIIGNTLIKSNTSALVDYVEGKLIEVCFEKSLGIQYLKVYRSDSEVTLYINGDDNTNFYSYLSASKENYLTGLNCSVVDENGVNDTVLKKIKGRGNTTWKTSDKKPFNITFDSKTNIGGITSKKFSLLSNPKDGTLLRNRIMYDLADEVGCNYSTESRSVDLYMNGVYYGAYQLTQKVELGKNSLVALKDESDTLTENFNFLIEIDVWNYSGDTYFKSKKGIPVVCKSPDLENYDGTDEFTNAQYNYIKNKYQQLEDALYYGTLSDVEQICDIDSLAKAYLLQEFGKNCDGGMTSCFFVYNASEGKFYADPIWDCDSCLGNVSCTRKNATDTADYMGWAIKTAQYDNISSSNTVNILGQAFYTMGYTSNNEDFDTAVRRVWNKEFIPAISVLFGGTAKGDRIRSFEKYRNISPISSQFNYRKWSFSWFPYYMTLNDNYTRDLDGQINYMIDWIEARTNWMNSRLDYYEPEPTPPVADKNYYLTGIGFGGWGAKDYPMIKAEDGTYYADIVFKAGTEYTFKIFDGEETYYTANLLDNTTKQYISLEGIHENAYILPSKDMNVQVILKGTSFSIVLKENPIIYGDVDGDGFVNIIDATLIQQFMVNLNEFDEETMLKADVNLDNTVDILDVTYIQLYIAQLIETIPVK